MELQNLNAAIESNCLLPNSKISALINRLTKMSKNLIIESDLSQTLDEFLQKLNECESYLENGIFNMNFAEAALLLQSSADIYSKKVDLLWDIIFDYQKRILLNDDQNANKSQEIEKLEERKRKYKRKRKTNDNETQTTKLVSRFSFGNVDNFDYLNQSYEQSNLSDKWKKFDIEREMSDNTRDSDLGKNCLFLPSTSVYTEDNEYIGRYDQFHSASLEEIFNLYQEAISVEEPISSNKSEGYINEINCKDQLQSGNKRDDSLSCNSQMCCKRSLVILERLPFHIVKEKLRRISLADSLFDDDHLSSVSENCSNSLDNCNNDVENITPKNCDNTICENETCISFDQVGGNLDKRNKSCSQDSAFYELEDEENNLRNTPIIDNQLCCGSSRPSRVIKRKAFTEDLWDLDRQDVKKRRHTEKRISKKYIEKLSTGVTVNHREFEKFCRIHYRPEENEGEIRQELIDSEDSDEEENRGTSDEEETEEQFEDCIDPSLDLDENNEDANSELSESQNADISSIGTLLEDVLNPDVSVRCFTPTAEISAKTNTSELSPANLEAEEVLRKNVREWRSFILPKLKTIGNKSDFDIHQYGSNIIEPMKIGEKRSFKDIVLGKSAAEVARYFIATLQLANTNNLEIIGGAPGQIANNTFQVKALDKIKHHELLEEYQAPSEETFKERLERAKAMNPKVLPHSTPLNSPVKKPRLMKVSRKRLF